jgi:hypothetical protein
MIEDGFNQGTIFYGALDVLTYVGGIIGLVMDDENSITPSNIQLVRVTNSGDVTGFENIGGILGGLVRSNLLLESVINTGQIRGTKYVGGLLGESSNSQVTMSAVSNQGDVFGVDINQDDAQYTGGLIGRINDSYTLIENTYNTGSIAGNKSVGGLVGQIDSYDLELKYSYNAGSVTTSSNETPGSIIGRVFGDGTTVTLTSIYSLAESTLNNISIGAINTGDGPNQQLPTISGTVTPISITHMKSISTFEDARWEIENGTPSDEIWSITEGETFPWLSFQEDPPINFFTAIINTDQLMAQGFIPIASVADLIAINSSEEHTFAENTLFSLRTSGGLDQN